MSEYCLRYTCRAKTSKHKADTAEENKRLPFLLFQDYKNNGELCVQVPLTLPEGFEGVRIYHAENGVDVPQSFDEDSFKESTFTRKIEVDMQGSVFIRSKKTVGGSPILSGTGIIGFCKHEDKIPQWEDCFVYSMSFNKKQPITYAITESKKKIVVEVLHPFLRKEIVLGIYSARNGKPILKGQGTGSSGKIGEITLKTGKKGSVRKIFDAETTGVDYRLFFSSAEDSKFFLLLDESEETIEEAKSGKKKKRTLRYHDDFSKTEVKKCPYCFGVLDLPENYKQKNVISECNCGKEGGINIKTGEKKCKSERVQTAVKSRGIVVCGKENRGSATNLGLYKNLILPKGFPEKPNINVVVIGAVNSGKSVLLSTILGANDYSGTESEVSFSPHLLSAIVSKYARKNKVVEYLTLDRLTFPGERYEDFLNVTTNNIDVADIDNVTGVKTAQSIAKGKYLMAVGKKLPNLTVRSDLMQTNLHPFGFRLGDLGFAHFYDVPGETVSTTSSDKNSHRPLKNADCLIVALDCDAKTLKSSVDAIKDALVVARELLGEECLSNIPVAIVLTKFDKIKDGFDDNCHVQRENMLELIGRGRMQKTYRNSALQRHVNCTSYEIEHYLQANGFGDFLKFMEQFRYCKFFAVSALGSADCVKPSDNTLIYKGRPLRLELPIIWLLYQKGLID